MVKADKLVVFIEEEVEGGSTDSEVIENYRKVSNADFQNGYFILINIIVTEQAIHYSHYVAIITVVYMVLTASLVDFSSIRSN